MELNNTQKDAIIEDISIKYNPNISISDSVNLKLGDKSFQVCTAKNDKVRILFVLFDANNHTIKDSIVKQLCQQYKFDIGHSVHYQFDNGVYLGINLSNEI